MKNIRWILCALPIAALLVSCSSGPSPAQISTLEASEQQAGAAESEVANLEKTYADLETDLERAQLILSENQSERDILKDKLGK